LEPKKLESISGAQDMPQLPNFAKESKKSEQNGQNSPELSDFTQS
jgi:hypothetical protein